MPPCGYHRGAGRLPRSGPAPVANAGRLAAVLLILGMLVSSGAAGAEPPLRIGVSLGLTGRFDVMSDAILKGFRMWERHVNERGGIAGKTVQVIVEDDRSDPERAQAIYRDFVQSRGVDFLFAPYSSLVTEAVLPIAEENRIPILIGGAAADRLWEKGFRYPVGIYTPASKFTVGFLELLVWKGLDDIALLYAQDPFSADLADGSRKWAERFGLRLAWEKSFPKTAPDFAALAEGARQSGAQVVMMCGHMGEAVGMRRALKQIGWSPKAYYASVGPALQAFYDKCREDAEGVFGTSLWEPRANFPGSDRFEQGFIRAYGKIPGYHAGLAYAAGQVLEEGIREANSLDREAVRNALYQLDTMTIIGRFGVDSGGKQVRQQTFIIQWQGGRKELVWPEALKTAPPRFP